MACPLAQRCQAQKQSYIWIDPLPAVRGRAEPSASSDLSEIGFFHADELKEMSQKGLISSFVVSWTPIFRPLVKFDFCRSAVDKKEQTYESKTEKTQCGLQGQ
ncbi:MAG: hypothetical protein ACLQU4_08455, partial [Limisphaerales bacterium]